MIDVCGEIMGGSLKRPTDRSKETITENVNVKTQRKLSSGEYNDDDGLALSADHLWNHICAHTLRTRCSERCEQGADSCGTVAERAGVADTYVRA